jgi:hypothetical protein
MDFGGPAWDADCGATWGGWRTGCEGRDSSCVMPFVGEKYQLELFCRMFREDVAFCGC